MFYKSNFNEPIGDWDVSSATDMYYMFGARIRTPYAPFNQDISNWDVSNVINMVGMFSTSRFNQDLSSWNVSNVTKCRFFADTTPFWTLPKPNLVDCQNNE